MASLLHESVAVLGRMRWFVLALLIALPLNSALQMVGEKSWRSAQPVRPHAAPTTSVLSVITRGVSGSVGLFHNMGLGNAAILCALFVLIQPRRVSHWLRENAQLGRKTLLVFWTILMCAVVTLLHPILLTWELAHGRIEFLFLYMTFGVFQMWFFSCVAAFWQVTLYPIILRAWSGRETSWGEITREPASTWNSLRIFNFVVSVIPLIVLGGANFLPLRFRFQGYNVVTMPTIIEAAALFPIVLVPFGIVVRKLSIAQGILWGIRSLIAHFEYLLVLLVCLAVAFAVLNIGESWLGSVTAAPQLIRICMQPLRGLLAAFGLAVGAQYFNRITGDEISGNPSVSNPGIRN